MGNFLCEEESSSRPGVAVSYSDMRRCAALVLLAACSARQARTAHRAGEVATAGGLVGILASVAVAELVPSHSELFLGAGLAFVPVSVLGALTYAATDGMLHDPAPDVRPARARDLAFDLARQAKHAARRGDCAEVLAIEPRVRELDAGIYRRFRHDKVISTCLPPAPPDPSEPPPAPVLSPPPAVPPDPPAP
jgi:hypothetical protein